MKTSNVQGSPRSLEPAMLAAIDLDQFAQALPPQSWLVEASYVASATATRRPRPTTSARSRVRPRCRAAPAEPPPQVSVRSHGSSAGRVPGPAHEHLRPNLLLAGRPRLLWIRDPPPPSRYLATSRCALSQAHAQQARRRLRRATDQPAPRSRPQPVVTPDLLICSQPICCLQPSTQDGAATLWLCRAMTLLLCYLHRSTVHNMCYRT